ncbi:hypothetical protein C8R46DRAFT_1107703 [Mycena filopes]|nr:hypothetical protein C8R46DRAFT_1107703 [Mycena filopes]
MSSAKNLPSADHIFTKLLFQSPTWKLIGVLLDCFLFGALLVQIYIYRICFPRDLLVVKLLVYSVLITCALCGLCETLYLIGIISGDFETFTFSQYLWWVAPLLGSLVAALVQLFYCYRMVTIRKKVWPVAAFIGLLSIAEWAVVLAFVVLGWNGSRVADRPRSIIFCFYFVAGAFTDILIAVIMTTLLVRASTIPQTRDIIKNIVRVIVETNTLTAIVGLLAALLFLCIPNTLYYICPTISIPGIYANTLLVVLNERAAMRRGESKDTSLMVSEEGARSEV